MHCFVPNTRIFMVALLLLSSACKKTESPAPDSPYKAVNEWIETVMKENYLWYEDIPASESLNYDDTPEVFFTSLLSEAEREETGNIYSRITKTEIPDSKAIPNTDDSYGFEFSLYGAYRPSENGNKLIYVGKIQYILPDSPAAEAGLRRGDFIMSIDGQTLDMENYELLYRGGEAEFRIGRYDETTQQIKETRTVKISASRIIDNNPVYLSQTYETDAGKVGYLVYNHFSVGTNGTHNTTYDDILRREIAKLKTENIDKLILDLRYNTGGALSTCILLSSMLVQESNYNRLFCTQIYNDRQQPNEMQYFFSPDYIQDGANLNLSELYVLTGNRTASASETLIQCLSPYMNIITIGKTTEGKNVGSSYFSSAQYGYCLWPITYRIRNSRMETGNPQGITPSFTVDDSFVDVKELGASDELLLQTALQLIEGSYPATAGKSAAFSRQLFPTGIDSFHTHP